MKPLSLKSKSFLLLTITSLTFTACTVPNNKNKLLDKDSMKKTESQKKGETANKAPQAFEQELKDALDRSFGDINGSIKLLKETQASMQQQLDQIKSTPTPPIASSTEEKGQNFNPKNESSNGSIEALQKSYQALVEQIQTQTQTQNESRNSMTGHLSELQTQMDEMKKAQVDLLQLIDSIDKKAGNLKEQIVENKNHIDEVKKYTEEQEQTKNQEQQVFATEDRNILRLTSWETLQGTNGDYRENRKAAHAILTNFDFQYAPPSLNTSKQLTLKIKALRELIANVKEFKSSNFMRGRILDTSWISRTGTPNDSFYSVAIELDSSPNNSSSLLSFIVEALKCRVKGEENEEASDTLCEDKSLQSLIEDNKDLIDQLLYVRINSLIEQALTQISPLADSYLKTLLSSWTIESTTTDSEKLALALKDLEGAADLKELYESLKEPLSIRYELQLALRKLSSSVEDSSAAPRAENEIQIELDQSSQIEEIIDLRDVLLGKDQRMKAAPWHFNPRVSGDDVGIPETSRPYPSDQNAPAPAAAPETTPAAPSEAADSETAEPAPVAVDISTSN